jgi:hypothetical protein
VYVCVEARVRVLACRLAYPACNVYALYCNVICGSISYVGIINGMIFAKKALNMKCVFWFSLEVLFEIFLVLRRNQRDIVLWKRRRLKCLLYLSDFNETRIFSTGTVSHIKFNQNSSIESRVVPCGQIDGWMDMTKLSHFSQFCEICKTCKIH